MKQFQSLKIRVQITAVLIFSALLMTLYTSISSYELASREFRKMSTQLTANISGTTSSNLIDYFHSIEEYTNRILSDPALRRLAEVTNPDSSLPGHKTAAVMTLRNTIGAATRDKIRFDRVDILMKNEEILSTDTDPYWPDYPSCLASLQELGYSVGDSYIGTQWGLTPNEEDRLVLSCVRFLYDGLARKIGIAVFQIGEENILPLFSNLSGAYLTTREGTILTGTVGQTLSDPAILNAISKNYRSGSILSGRTFSTSLITYNPVIGSHVWLIVPVEAYEDIIHTQMTDYTRSVVLLLAAGILFSVIIARVLSVSLSRSVTGLTDFIHSTGDVSSSHARYKAEGDNEIAQIGRTVNDMLDKLQAAQETREKDIEAQKKLEMNLLRSQINPHLLYNSLNSALWAIQSNRNAEATELITDMSEYFKLALSGGRQTITLSEELQLIDHYLGIQRLARHREVILRTEIPEEFLSHPILKLTLQPIVENAVIHGFDGYRTDGTITIRAAREGDYLRITVLDNGIGIDPEELERLRVSLQSNPSENTGRSFGLYWINRSLRQTGDETCGLSIESEVSEYTLITVTMRYTGQEDTADV